MQFVHPSPLSSLKLHFQDLLDYFVDNLDLSVGLGVVHGRETLLDPQRFAKFDKLLVGELGSIVRDYLP